MTDFLNRFFDMPYHVFIGMCVVAFFSGIISRPLFPDSVILGVLFSIALACAYRAAWLLLKGI